jgi:hypothetical protein
VKKNQTKSKPGKIGVDENGTLIRVGCVCLTEGNETGVVEHVCGDAVILRQLAGDNMRIGGYIPELAFQLAVTMQPEEITITMPSSAPTVTATTPPEAAPESKRACIGDILERMRVLDRELPKLCVLSDKRGIALEMTERAVGHLEAAIKALSEAIVDVIRDERPETQLS